MITEPAVGYGLGVGALFFHESAEQRKERSSKTLLPANISVLGGGGTENGTWAGGVGHLGFWLQDTLRYTGYLGYGSINLDFYSLPVVGKLPRPVALSEVQLDYRIDNGRSAYSAGSAAPPTATASWKMPSTRPPLARGFAT